MKQMKKWLLAGLACVACLSATRVLAQDNNSRRGNFDPAEFQKRILENYRERLEIKDDAEWKAMQPLIQKVMDARRDMMSGMARGMFGRSGRPGGDDNGGSGGDRGSRRGGGFFNSTPSPEAEALQKAIDGKASNSELKAAIAKYKDARKAKEEALEKAQADLRKV